MPEQVESEEGEMESEDLDIIHEYGTHLGFLDRLDFDGVYL